MAFAQTNRTAARGLSFNFSGRLSALIERYAEYRTFRRTVSELRALDARALADLGLNASMIESIAHQSVYGKKM